MDMNQVTLPVKNMEEAVQFYLALGFTQIVDTPHYARFSCPKGDSTFSLSLESEEFKNGAVIYFETEELDELVATLEKKGIQFLQLPTDQSYLWKDIEQRTLLALTFERNIAISKTKNMTFR